VGGGGGLGGGGWGWGWGFVGGGGGVGWGWGFVGGFGGVGGGGGGGGGLGGLWGGGGWGGWVNSHLRVSHKKKYPSKKREEAFSPWEEGKKEAEQGGGEIGRCWRPYHVNAFAKKNQRREKGGTFRMGDSTSSSKGQGGKITLCRATIRRARGEGGVGRVLGEKNAVWMRTVIDWRMERKRNSTSRSALSKKNSGTHSWYYSKRIGPTKSSRKVTRNVRGKLVSYTSRSGLLEKRKKKNCWGQEGKMDWEEKTSE